MEKSICFISRKAHHILFNETDKIIGGAELQQAIIAKALCERGWRVSFITEKHNHMTPTVVSGITIFPVIDYKSGNRYIRRTISIPVQLWKSMQVADSQLYYQRNPGPFSAAIGIHCWAKGKRFILCGANDANFDRKNELNVNSFLDVLDIKYGIKLAKKIILQNKRQKYLLKKNYRRDGQIFYNLHGPPLSNIKSPNLFNNLERPRLLWAGRLAHQKRPELCLQLAKLLPDFEIIMVGSRTQKHTLSERIKKAAYEVKNINFVGHLSLQKIEKLFNSVQGLVNTSYVEGFPNSFLQAWSRGIPVFSFVDPDNLIYDFGLGVKVSSIEDMADAIRRKLNSRDNFQQQAFKIKSFFDNNFSVAKKIKDLELIFLSDYH